MLPTETAETDDNMRHTGRANPVGLECLQSGAQPGPPILSENALNKEKIEIRKDGIQR